MRKALVVGNWKMQGNRAFVDALVSGIRQGLELTEGLDLVLCPPFVYMERVARLLEGCSIKLGAQTLNRYPNGAYTGEISASMLVDLGCSHVIVGHTERRMLFGETDYLVARKFKAAQEAGLIPILCVGETLDQRNAGLTEMVVNRQIHAVLDMLGIEAFRHAVLSYEPVWAIGTGVTISPAVGQEVHLGIRQELASFNAEIASLLPILYGGSVKPHNAFELLSQPDIDGGLIGGASLQATDFVAICQAAQKV